MDPLATLRQKVKEPWPEFLARAGRAVQRVTQIIEFDGASGVWSCHSAGGDFSNWLTATQGLSSSSHAAVSDSIISGRFYHKR